MTFAASRARASPSCRLPCSWRTCEKGFEVPFMVDLVHDHAVQWLAVFEGKELTRTKKEGFDLDDEDEKAKLEELTTEFEPLTKWMKKVFGDKVEKVIVSDRIVVPPCFLTTSWSGCTLRQLNDFPHGVQEDVEGQPNTLHHDGVEERGVGSQIRQDGDGFDLASL